jgi:hypothetical protein
VSGASSQERPRLATHFVGAEQALVGVRRQKRLRFVVVGVTPAGERDPEGRVDEDQLP